MHTRRAYRTVSQLSLQVNIVSNKQNQMTWIVETSMRAIKDSFEVDGDDIMVNPRLYTFNWWLHPEVAKVVYVPYDVRINQASEQQ